MRRVFYESAPVTKYSPAVFDALLNQTKVSPFEACDTFVETEMRIHSQFWGPRIENVTLTVALEPFDSGLFTHGSGSAYPPDRSHAIFQTDVIVEWFYPSLDKIMAATLRHISGAIRDAALGDGQNVSQAAKYPNFALFGTPLENIYCGNLERLRKIRESVDPEDVMGLTGGWKF